MSAALILVVMNPSVSFINYENMILYAAPDNFKPYKVLLIIMTLLARSSHYIFPIPHDIMTKLFKAAINIENLILSLAITVE